MVLLDLDPKGFNDGQKQALKALKDTGGEATRTAKEMEARGNQAAAFFGKIRSEALALGTVLLGAAGLKEFTSAQVGNLSELGRAARDMGISVPKLAQLRNLVEQSGGSADAATASFNGLAQAIARAQVYGASPELTNFMTRIGASASDPLDVIYSKFNQYAQGRSPQDVLMTGQQGGLDIGTIRAAMKPVAEFQADMARAAKVGLPTESMTKNMQALQSAFRETSEAATTLGNVMLDKVAPGLVRILKALTEFIEKNPEIAGVAGASLGLAGTVMSWLGLRSLFGGGKAAATEAVAGASEAAAGAAGTGVLRWLGPLGAFLAGMSPSSTNGGRDPTNPSQSAERAALNKAGMQPAGFPAPNVDTKGRAKQAYDYFVKQGWTPVQAAAIAGALQQESGFNHLLPGDGGKAFGIAQWHALRRQQILKGTGIDIMNSTYEQQLEAVQWELNHNEKAAGDLLRAQTDSRGAANVTARHYERSADQDSDVERHLANSTRYLGKFGPSVAPDPFKDQADFRTVPGAVVSLPIPASDQAAAVERHLAASQQLLRLNNPPPAPDRLLGNIPTPIDGRTGNVTISTTHIGRVDVQTQAVDAAGVARGIKSELQGYDTTTQASTGLR